VAAASLAAGLPAAGRRAALVALVGACGALHGGAARERALSPPLLSWPAGAAAPGGGRALDVVELEGTLLADAALAVGGVRLLIGVARVGDADGWHAAAGRVQAHVAGELAPGRVADWTAGRPIRAPALVRRPQVWRNFGGPSETWQQLRRPFDLSATIKSAALVEVGPGAAWSEAAAGVRQHVRDAIRRLVEPRNRRAAAIALAILIGDRAALDAATIDRLQAAGTYHVIAISGGNVALLTALCFLALRLLLRSARASALLTVAVVVAYGGIVGGEPSVARAVCVAVLYLGASALGLRPRALHLLGTAAVGLAIADPLVTLAVGAWLSFGATLGIVLGAGRLAARLDRALPLDRRRRRLLPALARAGALLLAATIAAELALLPVTAAVFGRVTIAGLIVNFVAIPAMAVVQCAGLAAIAADAIAPPAAPAAAAWTVTIAAGALVDSARLVDLLPWLAWRVPPVPIWWTPAYYVAAAVALAASLPRVRALSVAAAAAALVVIVTAPDAVRGVRPPGVLRLVMLDVGQGEALLVQLPTGQALLVDAGGTPGPFDIGQRVVTPAVWAQRVRALEWLAVTHPDQDHVGGARSVASDLRPREIWEGVAVPRSASRAELYAFARARNIPWRTLRRGDAIDAGGVRLDVLHPPAPDWERQRVRNDDSIVLRLRYGRVELLLTGDAGAEFESSAPMEGRDPVVRVLKAGHHGSRTSSAEAFVRAYAPAIVLISAGRGNLFGHPAADVVERFEAAGAVVFRTDLDGAVMLETDGRFARVRARGGRTWTAGVIPLA
jgi:competence protein ComEC